MTHSKIVIVGGGPAGCACALLLAEKKIPVTIIEKAIFPRDKICGDALSLDVINQLGMISPDLAAQFQHISNKISIYGGRIISPTGHLWEVPILTKNQHNNAYVCPRLDFDNFLFQYTKGNPTVEVIEDCRVQSLDYDADTRVNIFTSKGVMKADLVIGADGAQSTVARHFSSDRNMDKKRTSAALRRYYEQVTGFHEENYIELYFFRKTIPGYLWVFPLADQKANVGIGILSSFISKKKINLKETLDELISTHPMLKVRFAHARALESVKGFNLPLASRKRKISGDRYLLLGDAASLIDPLSGEGIGNAIRSGRVAAMHIIQHLGQGDFSAKTNQLYDAEIYRRMWKELQFSARLQRILRYPRLLDFVIKRAKASPRIQQTLRNIMDDIHQQKQLLRPKFYWELLTK
ncbi:MAG: geranylgeranyl reductase family protein [Saprospiraceae bacterium]|nr:geranylgeranyl reductase family protein [Saprospiraceae bacterium]